MIEDNHVRWMKLHGCGRFDTVYCRKYEMPQWPKLLEQYDHKENSQTSFSFVPNEEQPEAEPSDSQAATITNKNDILGQDFMNTEKGRYHHGITIKEDAWLKFGVKMCGTKESLIAYETIMSEAKDKMMQHMQQQSSTSIASKGILDVPTITPASRGNKRSTYFWEKRSKKSNAYENTIDMSDPPMKKQKGRPKKPDFMAEV